MHAVCIGQNRIFHRTPWHASRICSQNIHGLYIIQCILVKGCDIDIIQSRRNKGHFQRGKSLLQKLTQLANIGEQVSEAIGRKISIVSGGNSAAVDLMLRGGIPEGVNNLRLGESLLFGKERAKYQYLPGTHRDVFTIQCEIVELKEKPSLPWGTVGVDSYGRKPVFTDRGEKRLKAVCALGKQDFDPETTVPADPGIILLGASSDHLMLDLTDAAGTYRLGDPVTLQLGYFSTMRAFTSAYVAKTYTDESGI